MKSQRRITIGVCVFCIVLLFLQVNRVSAQGGCRACDPNPGPCDLCNPEIDLGSSVVLLDRAAGRKLRHGWPAIVIGKQDNGYILLFNKPAPLEWAWYEIQVAHSGEGYPWNDHVRCVGRSWAVVDPGVVFKYIDCVGSLIIPHANGTSGTFLSDEGWECAVELGTSMNTMNPGSVRLQGLLEQDIRGDTFVDGPVVSMAQAPGPICNPGSFVVYEREDSGGLDLWDGAGILTCKNQDLFRYDLASFTERLMGMHAGVPPTRAECLPWYSLPSRYLVWPENNAAYICTEHGVIRDMDYKQIASASIIAFENRGGCYELLAPEIENRPWSDLYNGGSYRLSGFRECTHTDMPAGNERTVFCDQFNTTYARLGKLKAPMAVFPCDDAPPSPPDDCDCDYLNVPSPQLAFTGTEDYSTSSGQFTRYRLRVSNWNAYPDCLFGSSPELPPCGSNTNASRTWIDIYSCDDGRRLYGFCGLNSADDLNSLWFAVRKGQNPPSSVYIELHDRKCNEKYKAGCAEIDHSAPPPDCGSEDILKHNPATTRVTRINGRWKIVDGSHWMMDFGSNESEARKALSIIKHYGMDSRGFVGRPNPSMEYWLVKDRAPIGHMPGEDSIGFNPQNLVVKSFSGRWKIVAGNHWLMDSGAKEDEARKALCLIKKYGFTRICFVGRPDPSMIYFRK